MTRAFATEELRQPAATSAASGWFLRHLLRAEAWFQARSTRRVLYHMDERTLSDIGITHPDFAHRP